MLFYGTPHTDVTPIKPGGEPDSWWNEWKTVDVSAYVPAGATGVVLQCANTGAYQIHFGLRKLGSTDNIKPRFASTREHFWAIIGVDGSRKFQIWNGIIGTGAHADVEIYLVAYTTAAVLFTNAYDKTPEVSGDYLTVDCSTEAPGATGLIFRCGRDDQEDPIVVYVRQPGANWNWDLGRSSSYCLVGCTNSQEVEVRMGTEGDKLYLLGYVTGGIKFALEYVAIHPSTQEVWEDIDLSSYVPGSSTFALLQIHTGHGYFSYKAGVRKNETATDKKWAAFRHSMCIVELDDNHIIEEYLYSSAGWYFRLVGFVRVTSGYIWASDEAGETTELHYNDEDGDERAIEGADTGSNGDPGYLWVEGTYLHYIDSNGDERREEGTKEGATGVGTGHIWTESTKIRYIDSSGDERYIEGSVV